MTNQNSFIFTRESARDFISSKTEQVVATQLKTANRIIVSQERAASEICQKVDISLDQISKGVKGLKASFQWGFTEILWRLEQQQKILEDILETLQAPLDTQAKELRKRAKRAYENEWIDEALNDFLASEQSNPYDFAVHLSIGHIYFQNKKYYSKAITYYEKAAKYAKGYSSHYTAVSFFYLAEAMYKNKNPLKAYELVNQTIELDPTFYEANYNCARYCACLGRHTEAIEKLKMSITGDINYCVKADAEKDFDIMKSHLKTLFQDLSSNAQKTAELEIDKSNKLISLVESYNIMDLEKIEQRYNKAQEYINRQSFLDYDDAISLNKEIQKMLLEGLESEVATAIAKKNNEVKSKSEKMWSRIEVIWMIVPTTIVIIFFSLSYIYVVIEAFQKNVGEGLFTLIIFGIIFLVGGAFWFFIILIVFGGIGMVFAVLKDIYKKSKLHKECSQLEDIIKNVNTMWGKILNSTD